MFGIRYIKAQPTDYLLQYTRGRLTREGVGLSFFYFGPTTSLVSVPVSSTEVPFIFAEVTSDFQGVSVQGQITYRIAEPKKVAQMLNFALDTGGTVHLSDDPKKLPQRLVYLVQVLMQAELQKLPLKEALRASSTLVEKVCQGLKASPEISALGLEILGLSLIAIKPTPETARALEADAREQLLKKADEAIYSRRNSAVEQERAIKENELNTEIAVENKKRQIREAQMDADRAVQEKKAEMLECDMLSKISLEEKNKDLVGLAVENSKREAEAKAYGISSVINALAGVDPKVFQSLASVGMEPGQMIALAFRDLAQSAGKIGELNVSPDLLRQLLPREDPKK